MPALSLEDQVETLHPQSLNDFFGNLQSAVSKIQDALDKLSQNAVQGNASGLVNGKALSRNEDLTKTTGNLTEEHVSVIAANDAHDDDSTNSRPFVEDLAYYEEICAKHRRACNKMSEELRHQIAHCHIVGGDIEFIAAAEALRNSLLNPVQCTEKVLNASPDSRREAMRDADYSFYSLYSLVSHFHGSIHEREAPIARKVEQWKEYLLNGYQKCNRDRLSVCEWLESVHKEFFLDLETVMKGVTDELSADGEQSAIAWLTTYQTDEVEERRSRYIAHVFPLIPSSGDTRAWPGPDRFAHYKERCAGYGIACIKMREELEHLISHYTVVRGDNEVVRTAKTLQDNLFDPVECLKKILSATLYERQDTINNARDSFLSLCYAVCSFQRSLYRQKLAFYFREVKHWVASLWHGWKLIYSEGFMRDNEYAECLEYIFNDLLFDLESVMVGEDKVPGTPKTFEENPSVVNTGSVVEELKIFGEKALPTFLADEKERATSRYINITTIATFFSSVTATTLQISYTRLNSESSDTLRGVVNLFWFLSLVFSVSSGVNSLLGVTWRRSLVYYSPRIPPKLIQVWLEKAPMIFLIIAAVAFIIGLNLFAYLSVQPHYVSLATNVLTGAHSLCILSVTAWFIYQLQHETSWAKRFRIVGRWIRTNTKWIGKIMPFIKKAIAWMVVNLQQNIKTSMIWFSHLYDDYRHKLPHLQRNIYWSLGFDNRVAEINIRLQPEWGFDWPEPNLFSKLIRHVILLLKKCWIGARKALSAFILRCYRQCQMTGDIEVGGSNNTQGGREAQQNELNPNDQAEEAMHLYCISLQSTFENEELVRLVSTRIGWWEDGDDDTYDDEWLESWLQQILWGYPDIVQEFYHEVHPALAPLRERNTQSHANPVAAEEDTMPVEEFDDHASALRNDSTSAPTSTSSVSKHSSSTDSEPVSPPFSQTEHISSDPNLDFQSSQVNDRAMPSGTRHLSEDHLETSENDGRQSDTISHHTLASSVARSILTNSSPMDDSEENLSAQMSSGNQSGYVESDGGGAGSFWNGSYE